MSTQRPHFSYLVIGAGPAGLQMGYHLGKAGHDYLILEGAKRPGAFFEQYPRHRQLISINKVHTGYDDMEVNLRWDWNSLLSDEGPWFKDTTEAYWPLPEDLLRYLADYADRHQLRIAFDRKVESIRRDGCFEVEVTGGEVYTCDRLIVATGVSKPYVPDIPGIELVDQYPDVSVDPQDFVDQHVLVIGKGNSGFETADNLSETAALIHVLSPRPLTLAWKSHHVGHLRAINNNFLDTYQLKSQNAVLDATIHKIEKRDGKIVVSVTYSHAQEEQEELFYDSVICCTGFRFDASIFDHSCRPELAINDRFPAQTSAWESTNVPDLYFAGTITQVRDFKRVTSGFIHGFRYNVRSLHRLLEEKYHQRPYPSRWLEATPEALADAIIERVNKTSALWQQFGFLCDRIAVEPDRSTASCCEELPFDYVHDSDLGHHPDYFLLTLEFGKVEGDPFNIQRKPDPKAASESVFLHPVVRHYAGRTLLGEHHVLENLYGEWWNRELHHEPLLAFLRGEMRKSPVPSLNAGAEISASV